MIKKQKQSVKNEQINNDKTIVLDYDQPLTKREDILNVYKKARGRVNIQKLYDMLIKLDYIYPHHQVIGFYLEKAGFKEADLQLFDHNKELRFFVQRELKEKERKYSERWNLYYPEFL